MITMNLRPDQAIVWDSVSKEQNQNQTKTTTNELLIGSSFDLETVQAGFGAPQVKSRHPGAREKMITSLK